MINDVVLDSVRAAVIAGVFVFLWRAGRRRKDLLQRGWYLILAGFALLMFGSLLDITDNFPSWNRFVVIGDTPVQAFFEKFVGFVGGFILLAIGLAQWIPTVTSFASLAASEQRFRHLVEKTSDFIWEIDENLVFTYVSPKIEDLLGYAPEEVIGRAPFELMPPEEAQQVRRRAEETMRAGEPARMWEVTHLHRDGSRVVLEINAEPVRDEYGGKIRYRGVGRDITNRRSAETALELERYLLHSLMDNLPHNIYFKDADSRFIRINKALSDCFGLSDAAEALGKTDFDFFTEEHARQAWEDEQEILRTGRPVIDREEMETWLDRPTTWAVTTKMPLFDDDGKIVGTFGVSRDITAQKLAAEALRTSEIKYRTLFDASRDAIVLLSKEEGFISGNPAAIELFGCKDEKEFINSHPTDYSPEYQPDGIKSTDKAQQMMAAAMQTGTAAFEWAHRRRDGREFTASVALTLTKLEGRPILQATVRDVTAQKLAAEALRTSEMKYRTLYDASHDAIMLLTAEEGFLSGNPAAIDLFGCADEQQFVTCHPADVSPEYQPDGEKSSVKAQQMMAAAMEKGVHFFEWTHKQIDGTEFPATVLLTRMELEGRPILQATVRNITHQKQAAAALKTAKEAAEAANRAKSDFLANVSHEIRTPMNAIMGLTEFVLDTELAQTQKEYLTLVQESAEALLSVINDILDFSRIEANKLELNPAPFDLHNRLGDTMKSLALPAHKKGLELAYRIHPDVPRRLVGDFGRLRQIVVNLVGNAVKFTESGEVVLDVVPADESDSNVQLRFSVSDTGSGIPKEKQAAIFDAFEQVDPSTTRKHGGSGLGLAICAGLLERMGGHIWVESEEGRGSTFHFTARFERSPDDAVPTWPPHPDDVRGLRVLVVDDNQTNRHILEEMLRNWSMQPASAYGATEAIRVLREADQQGRPFAIVLTDANMPEVDGFSLAQQVNDDDRLSETPVIMLTSGGRPGEIERCRELGVAAYLLKPIKQPELFDAIVAAVGLSSGVDQPRAVPTGEQPKQLPPLRILLTEDSHVNQVLAKALLEKAGHTVSVANHGKEALAALESHDFDVILMDVQMPEMDGIEATRLIREREKDQDRHTPIVAMTAHALAEDRDRCLAAGMDEYVAKPIRVDELMDKIVSVLSVGTCR